MGLTTRVRIFIPGGVGREGGHAERILEQLEVGNGSGGTFLFGSVCVWLLVYRAVRGLTHRRGFSFSGGEKVHAERSLE